MERKLQVTTADSDTRVTKTYNHMNTDMTDSDCLVFAENLNMLSDNTLKKVVRTDKTNITNAQPPLQVVLTGVDNSFWEDVLINYIQQDEYNLVNVNGEEYWTKSVSSINSISVNDSDVLTVNCSGEFYYNGKIATGEFTDCNVTVNRLYLTGDYAQYSCMDFKANDNSTNVEFSTAETTQAFTSSNVAQAFVNLFNSKVDGITASFANNSTTLTASDNKIYIYISGSNGVNKAFVDALCTLYNGTYPDGVTVTTGNAMGTTWHNLTINKEA